MKLSVVLSTQQTQFQAASFSGSLTQNIADIAAMGYDGVELAIRDPKLVDVDALEALTREHGLRVPAIGTGQAWGEEKLSFTDPDLSVRRAAVERIKSHIPLAARFNAVIIIGLVRGIIKPGITHEQGMAWVCEALQECSTAAKPFGVRLALEPINRYETTLVNSVAQGMALIDRVGADNFGLLLDTFHMNIEEPDILQSISTCGDRIFHFHVADSNRWYPGAGHLDFSGILSRLQSTGYDGFVSGEFMPLPDPLTAARENIARLRAILSSRELNPHPVTCS
ncbi:MAG: sugar phosphate isomerase/epimerase [Chloroflexi bacterium]|nr:sugar phosphate isomerase/epimerase [Chloroflexota bacterium]